MIHLILHARSHQQHNPTNKPRLMIYANIIKGNKCQFIHPSNLREWEKHIPPLQDSIGLLQVTWQAQHLWSAIPYIF